MATYEREVKRRLTEAGFGKDRQGRTSHEVWSREQSNGGSLVLTVPSRIKNRHTANGILKQAGLPKLP